MKSFIHVVSSNYSLKPGRLVFLDAPEQGQQVEKAEVKNETVSALTTEQQDAKLKEDAHASALKAMEAAKGNPTKLAEAYDQARKTQSALYEGKNRGAIDQGHSDLNKMLTSMGVTGEAAEDIKAQYDLAFKADNLWGDVDFQAELDAASQQEATNVLLPALRVKYTNEQELAHKPMIAWYEDKIAKNDLVIKSQEGLISGSDSAEDFYDDKLEEAEDALSEYLDKYDIDTNGGSATREQFRSVITKMEGDETADVDIVEEKIDMALKEYQKLQSAVNAAKSKVDENASILTRAEMRKGRAEDEKIRDGLMLRSAQDTLSRNLKDIADGTYLHPRIGKTLQEIALANATSNQEDHAAEQAVLKKYAEVAQNKASELLKGVVLAKLDSHREAIKQAVADSEIEINELQKAHDVKIVEVETKARTLLNNWAIDAVVSFDDTAKIKEGLTQHVKTLVSRNGKFPELVLEGEVERKVNNGLRVLNSIYAERNAAKAAKDNDPLIVGEKQYIDRAKASIGNLDQAVAQLNGTAKQQEEVRVASK